MQDFFIAGLTSQSNYTAVDPTCFVYDLPLETRFASPEGSRIIQVGLVQNLGRTWKGPALDLRMKAIASLPLGLSG